MELITFVLVFLVFAFHLIAGFAELTMWGRSRVNETLQITDDDINGSPSLAAAARKLLQNSGIYNAIVAAGLAWSLWLLATQKAAPNVEPAVYFQFVVQFQSVLLSGAIVAGLYGFRSFNPPNKVILFGQVFLAFIALIAIWIWTPAIA